MDTVSSQSQTTYLAHGPLVYVLAVVDFEPLLNLGDYIPKIQDTLRVSGFPYTEEAIVDEITLNPQEVSIRPRKQWAFISMDRKSTVTVSESKLSLETANYTVFSAFEEQMLKAFNAFSTIKGPILAERLGLRYINALQPLIGEGFDSILHERLAGVREFAGLSDIAVSLAVRGKSSLGNVTIQVIQPPTLPANQPPTLLFPPNLTPKVQPPLKVDPQRAYRYLDLDHSLQLGGVQFDSEQLLTFFDQLHEVLDEAFTTSITDTALKRWKE